MIRVAPVPSGRTDERVRPLPLTYAIRDPSGDQVSEGKKPGPRS